MLERFFKEPKDPEEAERNLRRLIRKDFESGVNGNAIHRAFRSAQEENQSKGLGLTNNRMLNMVKELAMENITSIEDVMYGGRERTIQNIEGEIHTIRISLGEEGKR